jgi:hypothetical protein
MIKAILIDAKKQKVQNVNLRSNVSALEEAYQLMNVSRIERVAYVDLPFQRNEKLEMIKQDDLYVDGEGAINNTTYGFFFQNQQFMGSGLIIGCTLTDGMWSSVISSIDDIEVEFFGEVD